MDSRPSLKDLTLNDLNKAKETAIGEVLKPGVYVAKVLSFTEEPDFNYITVEINKSKYNFFYDFFIRGTQDYSAEVIKWMRALATIPTDPTTTLLAIANSAIGSSYKIEIYNYTSKSGKNAGKVQHAIRYSTLPVIETVTIETEEIELPL